MFLCCQCRGVATANGGEVGELRECGKLPVSDPFSANKENKEPIWIDINTGPEAAWNDTRLEDGTDLSWASPVKTKDALLAGFDDEAVPSITPLDEDKLIFESDVNRMEAAKRVLASFRVQVEDLLAGKPSKELSVGPAARHFCTDATLLRYLMAADSDLQKALTMLKATLQWRQKNMERGGLLDAATSAAGSEHAVASTQRCPCCVKDPRQHSFVHVGADAFGRQIIYSCSGMAVNKKPADGCRHMALELERIFDENSAPGSIVWVVDMAGFGLADCNPRTGPMALSMFSNHYPERFAQIILLGFPAICLPLYNTVCKIADPLLVSKIHIIKAEEKWQRYSDHYWKWDAAMKAWLEAAAKGNKGLPGIYPDIRLGRSLRDPATLDILERCATLVMKEAKA